MALAKIAPDPGASNATSSRRRWRTLSECFIVGTAAEVTPVSEIGPYRFTPGKITETLMNDYMEDVHRETSVVEL